MTLLWVVLLAVGAFPFPYGLYGQTRGNFHRWETSSPATSRFSQRAEVTGISRHEELEIAGFPTSRSFGAGCV